MSSSQFSSLLSKDFHPTPALYSGPINKHCKCFFNKANSDILRLDDDCDTVDICNVLENEIFKIVAIGPLIFNCKGNITVAFYSGNYTYKTNNKLPPHVVWPLNDYNLATEKLDPRESGDYIPDQHEDIFYIFNGIPLDRLMFAISLCMGRHNNGVIPREKDLRAKLLAESHPHITSILANQLIEEDTIRNILSAGNTTLCYEIANFTKNHANFETRTKIESTLNYHIEHSNFSSCKEIYVQSLKEPDDVDKNWTLELIFELYVSNSLISINSQTTKIKLIITAGHDFKQHKFIFYIGTETPITVVCDNTQKETKKPVDFDLSTCIDIKDDKKYSLSREFSCNEFNDMLVMVVNNLLVIQKPRHVIKFNDISAKTRKHESSNEDNEEDDKE